MELTPHALIAAVQAVNAEVQRIRGDAADVTELDPDTQELLLSYSTAATELRGYYERRRDSTPSLPPYDEIVSPPT